MLASIKTKQVSDAGILTSIKNAVLVFDVPPQRYSASLTFLLPSPCPSPFPTLEREKTLPLKK